MTDFVASLAAFRTLLQGVAPLPLYYANDDRDPITDGNQAGFIYSEGHLLSEGMASLGYDGNRLHKDIGEFVVTIFTPVNTKVGTAEGYAQTIRTAFGANSLVANDIHITNRTIGPGKRVEGPGGRWFAIPVNVHWYAFRTE